MFLGIEILLGFFTFSFLTFGSLAALVDFLALVFFAGLSETSSTFSS